MQIVNRYFELNSVFFSQGEPRFHVVNRRQIGPAELWPGNDKGHSVQLRTEVNPPLDLPVIVDAERGILALRQAPRERFAVGISLERLGRKQMDVRAHRF